MPLLDKFIDPRDQQIRRASTLSKNVSQTEAIIRNVQNILKARRTITSMGGFGLMDFCEQSLSEPLVHLLCEDIQQQIQKHERRLQNVQVTLGDKGIYEWNFLVSAILVGEPGSIKSENFNFILALTKN